MLAQPCRVNLSVRVPRGAAGDVEGGVRAVVEKVRGVDRVEIDELTGVRPDALDLYVDAQATVIFEREVADPEACLDDGFGVVSAALE